MIGLASLGLVRVLFHDLHLFEEFSLVSGGLSLVVALIWTIVVIQKRVTRPFTTLLMIGGIYGLLLALMHQLFWDSFWGNHLPSLDGNLSGIVSVQFEEIVLRTFAFLSSILTGLVVGAVLGLITVVIKSLYPKAR